jgi:hypothetical protein
VAVGDGHSLTVSHASPANVFPCPLPWVGALVVVRFSLAEARGVGQEEDAGALVRGSSVTRSQNAPDDGGVAAGVEVGGDSGNNSNCSSDVFPHDKWGLALDGDADVLEEQPGAVSMETLSLPGEGEILARRSTSDEIHESHQRASIEGAHVVPDRRLW